MINGLPTRGKAHPSFITNDRRVVLYMLDVAADGCAPVLRINIVERSQATTTSTAPSSQQPVDANSMENESMGDHSMDTDDHDIDVEECDGQPSGSQTNHVFNDGTDFYIGQTFDSKEHLKISLKKAAIKSMYESSDRVCIYKYVGEYTCGVEHVRSLHKHASSHVISSVLMNDYIENKGPSTKEIQRTVFREFHCKLSYWKCWKAGIIAKNLVRRTPEHGYGCLPAYSYMVESLNSGSRIRIRLSDDNRFLYYFVSYAACIRGYTHMRKVIAIDGTHLYGKYEGVLLSAVA
ncbi:uncharacterized protein LOC132611639 [Lycium barbarum]|uniref:uncharacterized protein LOC132611639 n=1 Tax=Lycium barbarum TaxID=112863 RepID=UPI00293EF111|nr:uncharacterized protein LOC132611639 [Lycium barbarum]